MKETDLQLNSFCLLIPFSQLQFLTDLVKLLPLGFLFVCICLILVFYLRISFVVKHSEKAIAESSTGRKGSTGVAKRAFLIIVTNLISWIPLIILSSLAVTGSYIPKDILGMVIVLIMLISCFINPIIYTVMSHKFQEKVKNINILLCKNSDKDTISSQSMIHSKQK